LTRITSKQEEANVKDGEEVLQPVGNVTSQPAPEVVNIPNSSASDDKGKSFSMDTLKAAIDGVAETVSDNTVDKSADKAGKPSKKTRAPFHKRWTWKNKYRSRNKKNDKEALGGSDEHDKTPGTSGQDVFLPAKATDNAVPVESSTATEQTAVHAA
jgi:hypothetical protein